MAGCTSAGRGALAKGTCSEKLGVHCRSVAACKAGDHSSGRFLMSQAHTARAQALAAHGAAAVTIEAAMNSGRGRGLWELDLHGLHSTEVRLPGRQRLPLQAPPPHTFVARTALRGRAAQLSGRAGDDPASLPCAD